MSNGLRSGWSIGEAQRFLGEHGLVISQGDGPGDELFITPRGRDVFLALGCILNLEADELPLDLAGNSPVVLARLAVCSGCEAQIPYAEARDWIGPWWTPEGQRMPGFRCDACQWDLLDYPPRRRSWFRRR